MTHKNFKNTMKLANTQAIKAKTENTAITQKKDD